LGHLAQREAESGATFCPDYIMQQKLHYSPGAELNESGLNRQQLIRHSKKWPIFARAASPKLDSAFDLAKINCEAYMAYYKSEKIIKPKIVMLGVICVSVLVLSQVSKSATYFYIE
jgi:hypothetical protein